MDWRRAKPHLALHAAANPAIGCKRIGRLATRSAQLARAMWATRCLDRNRHRASRAIFRHRLGCRRWSFHFVDRLDDKKNTKRDDDEVDQDGDEIAVCENGQSCFLGVGQRHARGDFVRERDIVDRRNSRLPSNLPSGGMSKSSTIEVTILPKAAPMMTPTARSMALPLTANSLNSFHMLLVLISR